MEIGEEKKNRLLGMVCGCGVVVLLLCVRVDPSCTCLLVEITRTSLEHH